MQTVMISLYADESADIRNYGSVADALAASNARDKLAAGMIHIGDIWPEIGALFKLLHSHTGCLLVTEDALRQSGIDAECAESVSIYYESQTHRPVAVFAVVQPEQHLLELHDSVDEVADEDATTVEQDLVEVEECAENTDFTDPFAFLQQAPDWLMKLKVSQLVQLTGRLENHFLEHDINTVAGILKYDAETMLRWPGFGKKSLTDLCEILRASLQAYMRANDAGYLFCDALSDAMGLLDEKERMVFETRFGFNGEAMTLEQIGESEGVTRERIRQIEVKAIQKMRASPFWSLNMVDMHLEQLLQDRDSPLFLQDLASEDEWFVGFSGTLECLSGLIELFSERSLSVLEIGSRYVVCEIDAEAWQQQINELLAWVKEQEHSGLTKGDIISFAQSCLGLHDSGELAHELYALISDKLHFSAPLLENEEAVLTSVGHGYIPLVLSVLRTISAPMHFREITALCVQRDAMIDERRVQNILVENACLYALGTYGLKEHLPLSCDEIERLKVNLATIIFSGDPSRQWNCQGLLEQLQIKYPNTPALVDKYIVDIVLDDVARLKSLGRLVWIRTDRDASTARRIDIQEMATDILKQHGGPMPIEDIKAEISKVRGVGEFFLLKTTHQIAKVSKAVWGVVDRDFFLTRDEIDALLNVLYQALQYKQRYIHLQEIRSILSDMGYQLIAEVTEYMVMSLSGSDERFHLSKGQLLGLSGWPDELREPKGDVEYSLVGRSGTIDLTGAIVVLTGTFQSMRRKDAKIRLEALGVTVIDKISSDTDHLIAGEGVQFNSKYKTARASGLSILSEESMLSFFSKHYKDAFAEQG